MNPKNTRLGQKTCHVTDYYVGISIGQYIDQARIDYTATALKRGMKQKEIVPHFGCEKALVLSDKYPNSQNYPNLGKPIPGCRFGYTYGSHPPKSDDQLEAQQKSSKTSASSERWEKNKEQASNAVQAVQTGVETVLAPPGTGEMANAVKAGTLIVTELPIHAAKTKSLARELEKETGEDMSGYYWQINDCVSKQDFKRLLTIQGKLRKRLKELEK